MFLSNNGVRPRKPQGDSYRQQNYWTTQTNQDPTPWYIWDTKFPKQRSKSEERPHLRPSSCDPADIRKDLREYLLTSTLHGLRYIGEKKLTWFERFFWLAAFSSSLVCASFFILNIYGKWTLSPMIVTINPVSMPLTDLPFPAITICNVNQAKKSVAERYRSTGSSLDKKLLHSLCKTQSHNSSVDDNFASGADWSYRRSFLINVTQPCNEMLLLCHWNGWLKTCQDLFNAQLTDEGLCCTFNAVHRDMMFNDPNKINDLNITFPSPAVDWTPENGYPADAPHDGFPWKPKGVGTHHGLSLVMDANIAEYYCGSTKSTGFKILLHNPTETPKIANLGEIYGTGIEARAVILPRILDAQPALRSIDIKKRFCLFSSEKTLVYFRTYTLKNCEMECEARAMLDVCNCVFYYMPKNRTTKICGQADSMCYNDMKDNISRGAEVFCSECLPACTEVSYSKRLSSAPMTPGLVTQLASMINKTPEYFAENMLVIHFFFEDKNFLRFTKGEIFGLTEFLSNTGGLLGLCMGFSMMSAVELLYYCTLRAFCAARRRRPKPFAQ